MSAVPIIEKIDEKEEQYHLLAKEMLIALRESIVTRVYIAIVDAMGTLHYIESPVFDQYIFFIRGYTRDNFHLLKIGDYSIPFGGINLAFFKVSSKALIILYAPKGPAGQFIPFRHLMAKWANRIDELIGDIDYNSISPEFQELSPEAQLSPPELQKPLLETDFLSEVPLQKDQYTIRVPVLKIKLTEKEKFPLKDMLVLQLCDGNHTIEDICKKTQFPQLKVDLIIRDYQKKKLIELRRIVQ